MGVRRLTMPLALLLVIAAAGGLARALASTVPPAPGHIDPVQLPVSAPTATSTTSTVPVTLMASPDSSAPATTVASSVPTSVVVPPTVTLPAEAPPVTVPVGTRPQSTTPTHAASPWPDGAENVDAAGPEVNTGDSDADEQADDDRPGNGNGGGGHGNDHDDDRESDDDRGDDGNEGEGGDHERDGAGGDTGFTASQDRRP